MITLPNIVLTDADVAATGANGKAPASAGDFLALLSQALPGGIPGADGKPLTLAELKAEVAGKGAPQSALAALVNAADADADSAVENPLAELLAATDGEDPLASLGQLLGNVKTADVKGEKPTLESDKKLSDDDMAALSALFAMLPQQVPTAQSATLSTATAGQSIAAVTTSGARASLADTLNNRTTAASATAADSKGAGAAAAVTPAATAQQLADTQVVQPVVAGEKVQADTSATASPASHNLTPLAASINTTTTQIATLVAPHINAQLGTPEWQTSVSQHITLFTRQGQQSAELRLHPEDLGSVQISLKIDDNQAQLQMVSPHSHVRSALEAALPMLRTQLAENGIQLGQSSISSESSAGGQQTDQQQQQASRGNGFSFSGSEDEVLSAPAALQAAARGNNAVDIFA